MDNKIEYQTCFVVSEHSARLLCLGDARCENFAAGVSVGENNGAPLALATRTPVVLKGF